jgi:hypothetical protein
MLSFDEILQDLLPDSPLFEPAPGEGLDQFLEGMATGDVTVYQFLKSLAFIRDPYRTTVLAELEREFGIVPNTALSEDFRRLYLAAIKYSKVGNGDRDFLEDRLHQAGFTNVFVYENDPRVDPSNFFLGGYLMYAGDTFAQADEPLAIAGAFEGELLVNGDIFNNFIDYIALAGDTFSQADEPVMLAGNFDGTIKEPIEYEIPLSDDYWPAIFFVGGPATFAPPEGAEMFAGDTFAQAGEPGAQAGEFFGQLTSIEFADIPNERRDQFRRLILTIKPLHSWAVLVVNYV